MTQDEINQSFQSQLDALKSGNSDQDSVTSLEARIAALEARLGAIGKDAGGSLIPPAATDSAPKA